MSWNAFGRDLSEEVVLANAEAMLRTGLHAAGYEYVCLDDHWHGRRSPADDLEPDPIRFPHGIGWLATEIHHRGLKLGIYTCAGPLTCGGEPGSEGFEGRDAATFAAWGIDYVKDDYCYAPPEREAAIERYGRMGEALAGVGREILFAVCEWGQRAPWEWAPSLGAQLWRIGPDIQDAWSGGGGIISVADQAEGLAQFVGPGGWNDPDMLVAGLRGRSRAGAAGTAGCTEGEYRTQMTLWAMLAAPLFISCDLRSADPRTLAMLSAPGVVNIDQDPLGPAGRRVDRIGRIDIWERPLSGEAAAVAVVNRSDEPVRVELQWPATHGAPSEVIDAWTGAPVPELDRFALPPHGSALYRGPREALDRREIAMRPDEMA